MRKPGAKRNIGAFIFGLVFAGVGIGFLAISIVPTLYDWHRMRAWQAVEAELLAADLVVHDGSDSTTYEATATYRYRFDGRDYTGTRVAINRGSDNIGDFQPALGRRLEDALQQRRGISIWVDPGDPSRAVINRDLRWGLLGFKLIFVLLFGGAGIGVLFWSGRAEQTAGRFGDKPWLSVPAWQSGKIRSDAKKSLWVLWGIAIVWNLVSSPLLFAIPAELRQGNEAVLIGLLFPVIGAGLLISAAIYTRRWLRFGPTPLVMDPFPGRLGATAGGHLDIKLPYDPSARFEVSLSCVRSYISGTGKNRSRKEKLLWQDSLSVAPQSGRLGTRLYVDFQVPSDLPSSEPPSEDYHKWTLSVAADLAGPDYSRQFEIPVFATEASSRNVSEDDGSETRRRQPSAGRRPPVDSSGVENTLGIERHHDGLRWHYPAGRNIGLGTSLICFGLLCAAAALFISKSAIGDFTAATTFDLLFGLVFDSVGLLMAAVFGVVALGLVLGGIYAMANSLGLTLRNDRIYSVRRLFGLSIRNQTVDVGQIDGIEKSITSTSSSGTRHKVNYTVHARSRGKKYTLAENLRSASQADAVIHYFEDRFRVSRRTLLNG